METKAKQVMLADEFNLASERVGQYGGESCEVSLQTMLDNGLLINVTAWGTREMAFPKESVRATVAITVKLWRVMHRIPKELTFFTTMRGRGHDILWLAAWVLKKARRYGEECAILMMPLPTDADEEDIKMLRVEYRADTDGRPFVTIGLADEFPLI